MSSARLTLEREDLWNVLVETVHALPMYKNHKRYVRDVMLKERPDISAKELSVQLNIPLGEAIVLLDELSGLKSKENTPDSLAGVSKPADHTLLDFSG